METVLFSSKRWWLWKGELCCVATWMPRKRRHSKCSKWPASAWIATRFQSFMSLINRTVHHAVLKFSPCLNKPSPQRVRIADWYLIHASASCSRFSNQPSFCHDCCLATCQEWWTRLCHERGVLVHCLDGRQTRPQCCVSLAAALASV